MKALIGHEVLIRNKPDTLKHLVVDVGYEGDVVGGWEIKHGVFCLVEFQDEHMIAPVGHVLDTKLIAEILPRPEGWGARVGVAIKRYK